MHMRTTASVDERRRVTGEYAEMPGLKLTAAQASRFWHLGLEQTQVLLESLVEAGTLSRTAEGFYVFAGTGREGA